MIQHPKQQNRKLGTLINLERLLIHETDATTREMIKKMPLQHLAMQSRLSKNHFLEFVNSSLILRESLEVFSTDMPGEILSEDVQILTGLLQFRKLRQLRLDGITELRADGIINILELLIANLPDIEIIEIKLMTQIALTENPIERDLTKGRISFSSRRYGFGGSYMNVVEYLKYGITNIFASSSHWEHFFGRTYPCARKTYLTD